MYEIVMLRLEADKVIPLICNTMQIPEVVDFAKANKGKDPSIILESIECNFDCKKTEVNEENPFNIKVIKNKSNYIVYINYNNGSEQTLLGYPTLSHARGVAKKFTTEKGTVKIYSNINDPQSWGELRLVETINYKK